MRYLLDVNILVAWGWCDHSDHDRVAGWIASTKRDAAAVLLTSAIPELGFVRVSVQRARGKLSIEMASKTLCGMLEVLGDRHLFIADDQSSTCDWPAWCDSAARTTDAHLLALAMRNDARLITLDAGIPGALLLQNAR